MGPQLVHCTWGCCTSKELAPGAPELAPGAPDPTQVLEPFVSDIVHLDFKPNSLRQDQLFSHCYYCLNNMFSACSP